MHKNKPAHILAIRLSALGDVAMTLPVFIALGKVYPSLRITLLTRPFFNPIFETLEQVSIYPAEVSGSHKGVSGLWRLYRELKQLDIDAVADLHNVLRSNILKGFFSLSALPFVQVDKGRRDKRALTALNDKVFAPLTSTHERYAAVFEKLGYPVRLDGSCLLPKRSLTEGARKLAGPRTLKWIGIAPFAAFPGKRYPTDLMETVLQELGNSGQYSLLLFGGSGAERTQLESWATKHPNCTSVAGKLSFSEELRLISNLDLMVSMDSANAHLAANYGIPVLSLWGLTHPYAGFYPFGQDPEHALLADRSLYPGIPTSVYGNKMPEGYEDVMRSIPPAKVVARVRSILGQ